MRELDWIPLHPEGSLRVVRDRKLLFGVVYLCPCKKDFSAYAGQSIGTPGSWLRSSSQGGTWDRLDSRTRDPPRGV